MSVKRRRTRAGWRWAHGECRGLSAWLQMELLLSLERETALLSGWGLGKLGLLVELVGRAGDRRGCPTLHTLVGREQEGISRGVGGARRGRWPLLGWRGGFDPVQFLVSAEVFFFFFFNHFFTYFLETNAA